MGATVLGVGGTGYGVWFLCLYTTYNTEYIGLHYYTPNMYDF